MKFFENFFTWLSLITLMLIGGYNLSDYFREANAQTLQELASKVKGTKSNLDDEALKALLLSDPTPTLAQVEELSEKIKNQETVELSRTITKDTIAISYLEDANIQSAAVSEEEIKEKANSDTQLVYRYLLILLLLISMVGGVAMIKNTGY